MIVVECLDPEAFGIGPEFVLKHREDKDKDKDSFIVPQEFIVG